MANEARNLKKQGTGKSAVGLAMIAVGIVLLIGLIVWILTNPAVLDAVVTLALAIVVALVVISLIIAGIMAIIALPMYAVKGEQYQEGVDYSLSDVKPVKESSSEKKENE
jgi:uncharacterized membrane protein (DUF485 family)